MPGKQVREPVTPRPECVRQLAGTAFGWVDARLLHDGWLSVLGPEARALYLVLCVAADRKGVSWSSRARLGRELWLSDAQVYDGLEQLERLGLVAYAPFSQHAVDGFRRVLALPAGGPPGLDLGGRRGR